MQISNSVLKRVLSLNIFKNTNYAPNFEKVGGHIGFGLSVCMYVCMYVFMFEISS